MSKFLTAARVNGTGGCRTHGAKKPPRHVRIKGRGVKWQATLFAGLGRNPEAGWGKLPKDRRNQ